MPPEYPDNSKYARRDQSENQSRIFNPCNRRDTERHDQAKKADLPGEGMHAGGKVPSVSKVKIASPVASALKTL
jgi:hypothetical protein